VDEYISFYSSDFLYNAGIVGFIKLLETVQAIEDEDYIYGGNVFKVKKEFFLNTNLAQAYIDTCIEKFAISSAYTRLLGENVEKIKMLTDKYVEAEDKSIKKDLDEEYKKLLDTAGLTRASYITACAILKDKNINLDLKAECKNIKAIKDYGEKYQEVLKLQKKLQDNSCRETFLMKDIMYSRINSIWSGKSFLNRANAKKDIKEIYYSDFIEPVIKYLKAPPKEKKSSRHCIVCDAVMSKPIDISFLNDSADDMSRKKSAFWNCKPDAQLCPLCAFIYSMSPLGFTAMQRNMMFVNDNADIEGMKSINDELDASSELESNIEGTIGWMRIWNKIVQNILKSKQKALRNIQVVVREKDTEKYNFNIIAKDILELLEKSLKYIGYIGNNFIKTPSGISVNIQDEVLKNIFRRTDLYTMMNKILNYAIRENIQVEFLDNVLQIQHMIVGGKKMEQNCVTQDDITSIKAAGKQLRSFSIVDKNGMNADEDGKLRGYAYKLLGALRVNDQEKFWQIVARMYLSYGKAIPETDIFLKAFKNEDNFKQLGYAYILGLKDNHKVEKNIKQEISAE